MRSDNYLIEGTLIEGNQFPTSFQLSESEQLMGLVISE